MFLSGLKRLRRLERQVKFAKNRCCKIKPVAVKYETKIHVSLDSVTNVTQFSDQPLMLEKYSFHISYFVD